MNLSHTESDEVITMFRLSQVWLIILLSVLVVAAGCARSPEAKKARHLARADNYFARERYREAIIEYRNVLRIEAAHVQAIRQLGFAYYRLGELSSAFSHLRKSEELDPADLEVRLKLATIYLLGGRPEEARQEAAFILERDPKNFEALAQLAGAARTSQEIAAVIHRLEEARRDFANQANFHLVLGGLYLRKQDQVGAESAFNEAVAKEPKSAAAHLALGNFHVSKRDIVQAERELKAAADLAPGGSLAQMTLADFYLLVGKPEDGKKLLREITQNVRQYLPAWRRLAEIAFAEGKYDAAAKALEVILKKNPLDTDALLIEGRLKLASGETANAIQQFQQVLKLEPHLAPARYQLALAQLRAGNMQQARAELKEATTTNPNFTEASLLGAELDIQMGAFSPAIETLQKVAANQPSEVRTYVLLGLAYLSKREPIKATAAYRKIVELAPKDPRGPYLVGLGLRAQGKREEAKKEFEASLALAPGFVEPLASLADMVLAEKGPQVAVERVRRQIERMPNSGKFYDLLGRIHALRGEVEPAEASFLKALELEPNLVATYLRLSLLYATSGKHEQALAKSNEALRANPRDLAALMLSGSIYEQKGDIAQARAAYEKALAVNPRFAPAANNLAYLYSEHGGDKEKALQLAQTAKEEAPDEPRISDTLGWILYKRGLYQRALTFLSESAAKLHDNPEVQYHLGMTHYTLGNREEARRALAQALKLNSGFPGAGEARRILAKLQ